MKNKILSLATDVNRTKLLLTSPLLFLVLTIATTPAQAQYWNGWYYQSYQQRYYSGYSHVYSDGQNNYTYDCSGHTSWYCSGYVKVIPTDKHNIRKHKQINRTNSNSSNNPKPRRLVALVVIRL